MIVDPLVVLHQRSGQIDMKRYAHQYLLHGFRFC